MTNCVLVDEVTLVSAETGFIDVGVCKPWCQGPLWAPGRASVSDVPSGGHSTKHTFFMHRCFGIYLQNLTFISINNDCFAFK